MSGSRGAPPVPVDSSGLAEIPASSRSSCLCTCSCLCIDILSAIARTGAPTVSMSSRHSGYSCAHADISCSLISFRKSNAFVEECSWYSTSCWDSFDTSKFDWPYLPSCSEESTTLSRSCLSRVLLHGFGKRNFFHEKSIPPCWP